MSDMQSVGKTFAIPARTKARLKSALENRSRIEQALAAANEVVGSTLLSIIDVGGGASEKLDDYIINIDEGTITEKGVVPSANKDDVEK